MVAPYCQDRGKGQQAVNPPGSFGVAQPCFSSFLPVSSVFCSHSWFPFSEMISLQEVDPFSSKVIKPAALVLVVGSLLLSSCSLHLRCQSWKRGLYFLISCRRRALSMLASARAIFMVWSSLCNSGRSFSYRRQTEKNKPGVPRSKQQGRSSYTDLLKEEYQSRSFADEINCMVQSHKARQQGDPGWLTEGLANCCLQTSIPVTGVSSGYLMTQAASNGYLMTFSRTFLHTSSHRNKTCSGQGFFLLSSSLTGDESDYTKKAEWKQGSGLHSSFYMGAWYTYSGLFKLKW